jgi:hypothetical protein
LHLLGLQLSESWLVRGLEFEYLPRTILDVEHARIELHLSLLLPLLLFLPLGRTTTIAVSLLLTVLVVLRLLLLEAINEEEEGLVEGDREVKVEGRLVA